MAREAVEPDMDSTKYDKIRSLGGGQESLNYGPPKEMRRRFAIRDWADNTVNEEVWVRLMNESKGKLTWNPFQGNKDAIFSGDFEYLSFGTASLSKCKRFGYNGFVDTLESLHEMYAECEKMGMLPRMKQKQVEPLI